MTSAVGLLEQARVVVKVWLEYVYLKYPPGTFYVIDELHVLEQMSGLDFCFRAFSLSVFATTPADFFKYIILDAHTRSIYTYMFLTWSAENGCFLQVVNGTIAVRNDQKFLNSDEFLKLEN